MFSQSYHFLFLILNLNIRLNQILFYYTMNIIKLDAISSTNDYLKKLMSRQYVENFTIVTAENQTQGKGQMGAVWNVAPGKNLTFSVLVRDFLLDIGEIFNLNRVVAVSIVEALETFQIPDLAIKWPNDIMAGNKKVGGILIENTIKNNGEIFSVVGIGLNVNQKDFSNLPKAASLSGIRGIEFDKQVVFYEIVENLKQNMAGIRHRNTIVFLEKYDAKLYKKGVPMPFQDLTGKQFMGIIRQVSPTGKLEVIDENETIRYYDIKEIQMLY